MILIGNQRGGAKDLAQHLLKEENDHVRVHELRGFVSGDLTSALTEAYAISRGTRCKQFLFSMSVNPPKNEIVSTADFEAAINWAESKLGLTGQPRAIVFHEKEGRRHAHVVWSRIKAREMKAVQLSHSKRKLMDVSRELHRDHGFKPPPGLLERSERDPRNFTLAQWQQAKRNGVDPRDIKTHLQDAWAFSDSKSALKNALEERGYRLARGDRRGFVAVDYRGEVYSLAKWAGVKTREIRSRLGEPEDSPSVAEVAAQWGSDMLRKVQSLQQEADEEAAREKQALAEKRAILVARQRAERAVQAESHRVRQIAEACERQKRFRTGLKGLWDRLRGEHRRIRKLNMREAEMANQRDATERDVLIADHLAQRRDIARQRMTDRNQNRTISRELAEDQQKYRDKGAEAETLHEAQRQAFENAEPLKSSRSRRRSRQRDGPSLDR
ncbi:MAG: relaxase [Alphaproteobacteria bacterium]|nr:relaxase [Alphaproteobacteria bacterium]